MKYLITGGAGFIGSHLVNRLLKKRKQVVVIDNFDSFYNPEIKKKNLEFYFNDEFFKFFELDIRKTEKLKNFFNEQNIDVIVHLAARPGVRPSLENPFIYEDINVKGTISLLECSREYGIKNFIFASSSSVYGVSNKVPFKETDPINKIISPYGISKRSGELYCYTYNHLYDIPIICLRLFTVYGPRQRPEMAIHKFMRLIEMDKRVSVYGDGSSRRDYTYIDDIIDGIESVLNRKNDFDIINFGNSAPVELNYLISLIEDALGKKAKIENKPEQPGDVPITYADISKAKKILGYNPQVTIEDGIKKMTQWYRTFGKI